MVFVAQIERLIVLIYAVALLYPKGARARLLHAFWHELVAMARDVITAPSWRQRVGFVFGPPGYGRGHKSKTTTAEIQRAARDSDGKM